jgi:L-ascorbate metabolism protein UlaG (beta-lactamase superfamily)
MDPRRAAEALRLLRPRRAVPIHWGTYAVLWSRRRATSPAEEFRRHAAELAPEVEVEILPVGGSVAL